jgi:hypothetical protein
MGSFVLSLRFESRPRSLLSCLDFSWIMLVFLQVISAVVYRTFNTALFIIVKVFCKQTHSQVIADCALLGDVSPVATGAATCVCHYTLRCVHRVCACRNDTAGEERALNITDVSPHPVNDRQADGEVCAPVRPNLRTQYSPVGMDTK